MRKKLSGIFAAMCTPLTDAGETIDDGRMREHIDYLIEAGVHGIVLNAGTGEFAYMRREEVQHINEVGGAHIAGRVPIISQPSAVGLSETIEKSKAAIDAGVDALMVLPPYLESPFDRGILFHYEQLANAVDASIVLYNIPDASGIEITPELYRRLIAIDNIEYIKDSAGDIAKQQKLIAIGGGVLSGADPIAPFALMGGAVGLIWGAVNIMPHEAVRLWDLVQKGDYKEAMELWALMAPTNLFLWGNSLDVEYLGGVKAATAMVGHDLGVSRRPQPPITGAGRIALQAALSSLPINKLDRSRLVHHEWEEERDWLVQMTKTGHLGGNARRGFATGPLSEDRVPKEGGAS